MPAIRCCGLTKRYGDRTVVDDLDLEVRHREVFGFLAPNGPGKTITTADDAGPVVGRRSMRRSSLAG